MLERLESYGADIKGIRERFMGDMELYRACLTSFLSDGNFAALGRALSEEDYGAAFRAAHTLKGVSGNMGLTPFYQAISLLTESLRGGQYTGVNEQYAAVTEEYAKIQSLE